MSRAGRELGALIIVVGVGIFGTLTGYLANLFLAPRASDGHDADEAVSAAAQLRQIKDLVDQQQAAISRLEDALQAD